MDDEELTPEEKKVSPVLSAPVSLCPHGPHGPVPEALAAYVIQRSSAFPTPTACDPE